MKHNLVKNTRLLGIIIFVLTMWIFGCSSGSGGGNDNKKIESGDTQESATNTDDGDGSNGGSLLTGYFKYLKGVQGLVYKAGALQDVTDKNGRFKYYEGETVIFNIGSTPLGEIIGKPLVTPLDFGGSTGVYSIYDQKVTNICCILETIDNNGDPDDGIVISESYETSEDCILEFDQPYTTFENDTCVLSYIGSISLIHPENVQAHLEEIIDLYSCAGVTCINGSCDSGACVCDFGYYGESCELVTNAEEITCGSGKCSDHGICVDGSCICTEGYNGDACQTPPNFDIESFESFIGTESGNLVIKGSTMTLPLTQKATEYIMKNYHNIKMLLPQNSVGFFYSA